jgi:hypothetical protein
VRLKIQRTAAAFSAFCRLMTDLFVNALSDAGTLTANT